MHKSFLLLWLLGWFIGALLMSKSFRKTSHITFKRVIIVIIAGLSGFGYWNYYLELLIPPYSVLWLE